MCDDDCANACPAMLLLPSSEKNAHRFPYAIDIEDVKRLVYTLNPSVDERFVDLVCRHVSYSRDDDSEREVLQYYDEDSVYEESICLFYKTCGYGLLKFSKWLHSVFEFKRADVAHDCFGLFRYVCVGGDVGTAVWMSEVFDVPGDAVRHNSNEVFTVACCRVSIPFAEWMRTKFGITAGDVKTKAPDGGSVFRHACDMGLLDVAKWLHETFSYTKADVRHDCYLGEWLMHGVYKLGYDDLSEWLEVTFNLRAVPPPTEAHARMERMICVGTYAAPDGAADALCCICCIRGRDLRNRPCGHDAMCLHCAREWFRGHPSVAAHGELRPTCVECRGGIDTFELRAPPHRDGL